MPIKKRKRTKQNPTKPRGSRAAKSFKPLTKVDWRAEAVADAVYLDDIYGARA